MGRSGFLEEALDWFDHYLKGKPFRYGANAANVVEVQDNEGAWRTEATYPPADARLVTLPVRAGTYTDDGSAGYWTLSQALPYDLRVSGEPTFTVDADILGPFANLVGVLYDYNPANGVATELSRGAYRLEGDGRVSFRLHPRDHILRAGHRIAFEVGSSHPEFLPHWTRTPVTIRSASVAVPFLRYQRVINLTGTRAAARAYEKQPSAAQTQDAFVTMGLPSKMVAYPDAATREAVQPAVSTPVG